MGRKGATSFTKLQYHLVFATKERRPMITPDLRARLVPYMGGILRSLGGQMLNANGTENHMHIATILDQKHAVMDVLKDLKGDSSAWVHSSFPEHSGFGWQDGYSAFTVSESVMPSILAYIAGQVEHHAGSTFERELVQLLERHNIKYDPRYLWA